MMPKTLQCEECGHIAKVRGYGRVEYAWPQSGQAPGNLEITMIRMTIDCPECGIRTQDHYPRGTRSDRRSRVAAPR
jgi:hypothetical protein